MNVSRRTLLKGSAAAPLLGVAACASTVFEPPTRIERERDDGVFHIGNSTHLVVIDGLHILTDPWLRDPADGVLLHRVPPAPLPTHPDVVLITHEHEDHFDVTALALVDKRATVVVPVWLEARTKALGFTDVRTSKAGAVLADVRGLKIEAVEALHDVIEVCYRVQMGDRSFFFGGDTLPTTQIEALAARAPVDLAILPADGGALLGKRYVMNPEEAIAMAERFGVRAANKGALLTHHECSVAFPWGAIVDVKPPVLSDFPPWFKVPVPGARTPFPWAT